MKRRHLELLGHVLVTVPYREWEGCKGAGEREQYLRGKLEHCVQKPGNSRLQKAGKWTMNSSTPKTGSLDRQDSCVVCARI